MKLFPNGQQAIAYLYLAQLIIPAAFLFTFPIAKGLVGAGLLITFAAVYIRSYKLDLTRAVLFYAGAELLLIIIMAFALNPMYLWLFYYPVALISYRLMGKRFWLVFGLSSLVIILAALVSSTIVAHMPIYEPTSYILYGALGILSMVFGIRVQRKNALTNAQLAEANQQIERLTKVAERERISRDLHDIMGHELSMISLKSQLADRLIEREPLRARQEVRDIEQAARRALSRVRDYIQDVRQAKLEEEWHDAAKFLTTAGIELQTVGNPNDFSIRPVINQCLAMALRESATNIYRHSLAQRAIFGICSRGTDIFLVLADDGVGMSKERLSGSLDQGRHGITGLRSRMAAVDGTLSIWSNGHLFGTSKPTPAIDVPWSKGLVLQFQVPNQLEGRSANR